MVIYVIHILHLIKLNKFIAEGILYFGKFSLSNFYKSNAVNLTDPKQIPNLETWKL